MNTNHNGCYEYFHYFSIYIASWLFCFVSPLSVDCNKLLQPKPELEASLQYPSRSRRRQVKLEYEKEDVASRIKGEEWEPLDWKKQLDFIRGMRSGRSAPVDNMGAEKCYDTDAPAHVGVGWIFLHKVSVIHMSG